MHPQDCRFERQMQYGSIGWSVGATLGYQAAVANKRRIMALTANGEPTLSLQQPRMQETGSATRAGTGNGIKIGY